MIRKIKIATSLAGVASLLVVGAGTLGTVPAAASSHTPVACSVTGTVSIAPGIEITPSPTGNAIGFVSVAINCVDPTGSSPTHVDVGTWNVSASGSSDPGETCAAGTGGGTFTAGTSTPHGNVTSGSFTFVRIGTAVAVEGEITTATNNKHTFAGNLSFSASNGECHVGGTGPTTAAAIVFPSEVVLAHV